MKRVIAAAVVLPLLAACQAPMTDAVRRGDAREVAALLDAGADVNERLGLSGVPALQTAAAQGRAEIVSLLLDRGADVNLRHQGTSALTQAVVTGNVEMVRLLLSRGAQVENRELTWAAGPRRDEILALLKEAKRKAPAAPVPGAAAVALSSGSSAGVDEPVYSIGEHSDDVALVVGIPRSMDGLEARFAAEDAAAVRRHLIALGVPARNVVLLTDEAAGRAGLSRYLERWLPNNVVGNSRVFFYFAGAGTADAQGRAYLLPWDGDAAQPEATGYPLSRLYAKLNALKARSAVAIVDAGFSGAGPRTAAAPKATIPALKVDLGARELGDAVALIACQNAEQAGVEEAQHHGALTYFLLKGLNGEAVDPKGFLTLKSLYRYARARIAESAARMKIAQTPVLMTGGLGESDLRLR